MTPKNTPVALADLSRGIRDASQFLIAQATERANKFGFGWQPSIDAPNTFEHLAEAWNHSVATGAPLPVSSINLDDCFYTPDVVHALRFYHDSWHMETGYTFDRDEEVELGIHTMLDIKRHGVTEDSLIYRLLDADFVGQAVCLTVTRIFTTDQAAFIIDCVQHGLEAAIQYEISRLQAGTSESQASAAS